MMNRMLSCVTTVAGLLATGVTHAESGLPSAFVISGDSCQQGAPLQTLPFLSK